MSLTGTPWERPREPQKIMPGNTTTARPLPGPSGTGGTGDFRVGAILGQAFSILFANIVPFGLLAILVTSPPYLYALVIDPQIYLEARDDEVGAIWSSIGFGVVDFLLRSLLSAALVYGTVQELRGQRASLGDCMVRGLSLIFPVIGVAIVAMIATGLASILLLIPGLIVMVMLWVAIPAAVIERQGVFNSLSRSAELTKGFRWKIFFVAIILFLLTAAVGGGATALTLAVFPSLGAYLFMELLTTAAFAVFSGVITAVIYHQLRLAKEGGDINEIAAVFD